MRKVLGIGTALATRGNDYRPQASEFRNQLGCELTEIHRDKLSFGSRHRLRSISVVIPSHNGERTLSRLLRCLTRQAYGKLEVVVVDDGSTVPIQAVLDRFTFPNLMLKLVRVETSRGIASARNIGAQVADGEVLVFLDDDLLVPTGLMRSLGLRFAFSSDFVFVGFRDTVQWIEFESPRRRPRLEADWRVRALNRGRWLPLTATGEVELPVRDQYSLLEDTALFAEFGHARVVGYWDLPNMVVGHSIAVCRDVFAAVGGFHEGFTDWGTEDLFFGASLIYAGTKIVPARDWVSLHPIHEGRKMSRTAEMRLLPDCLAQYRERLRHTVGRLPRHRISFLGRSCGMRESLVVCD